MSTMAAGATLSLLVLLLITSSSSSGAASSPGGSCSVPPDGGSTLRIIHAFGPCSPLRPAAPLPSWADFLSACGSPACSQVPAPSCSPANSCSFNMSYGGSSLLAGLVQDSLSLAADVVPSYTFGCLQRVTGSSAPPQGLLGLGRGPLSFLSQTQNLYGGTFSYCLPSFKSLNFSGTLRLGPKGQPQRIKTTPLLANPHRPSLYYVNMTGVRVGRRVLPIPPSALAFDPATGAGTVVDAGTMFTRLAPPAYAALRDEFRRRVRAPLAPPLGGFDTCYNVSIAPAPAVTFLFDGAAVTLPEDNVLIHSTAGTITCLAMAAAPDGLNAVLNVIANMQQQNHRVLFDVPNARVGFAREMCT
ncbi:aspartyl protease AED3-like [Ananas comosus]|uniref:Aspartyl protease AED3-like n=1 Tax=Ananas comosus TaxID=4615 RepID=A0A6P5GJ98_ANACO|nr:aspartyl protease AED3-like [Ananas comosus]